MTISGGGYNINYLPTPSIYERETTAQQELQKQADIGKGNVVIVPQSEQDLVPFTKMAERNTWNYKSEANRPSLLPMGALRGAGPEVLVSDEAWLAKYAELYDQLPADVREELDGLPTIYGESMKLVLETMAKALAWQEFAEISANSENALRRVQSNLAFSNSAFSNTKETGEELVEHAANLLEDLGPNDPNYLETKEYVAGLRTLLNEVVTNDD